MLTRPNHRAGDGAEPSVLERGFTLLEIMIVTGIMGVILVIASAALISLSQTTNRGDAMVAAEQSASTALAQLSRDIRSAHSLSFPTGVNPADEVDLQENQPGGTPLTVQWVYTPPVAPATIGTLVRQIQNGAIWSTAGVFVSRVANPTAVPPFAYYDDGGNLIPTSGPSINVANCATRINVQLYVAPRSGITGVSAFHISDDVALTDQLGILSTPGQGQCDG